MNKHILNLNLPHRDRSLNYCRQVAALCWWTKMTDMTGSKIRGLWFFPEKCPHLGPAFTRARKDWGSFGHSLCPWSVDSSTAWDGKTRKTFKENSDLPGNEGNSTAAPIEWPHDVIQIVPPQDQCRDLAGAATLAKMKWFTFGSHSWCENKHRISSFL